MRPRHGGSWRRSQRGERALLRELGSAIGMVCALALEAHAQQAPAEPVAAAPEPPAIALTIERCVALPFDADAYERALSVELRALHAQAADPVQPRALLVRAPECGDRLEVSLRTGDQVKSESLRASDYAGVGQERALALATIEALRVLSAPPQAEPAPAVPSPPPPPPAPASQTERENAEPAPPRHELHIGAGAGLFDTLALQAELGVAYALTRTVWLATALSYGQASDESALGSIDASALTMAAALELRVSPAGPLELSFGAGLRGGIAWASIDSTRPLASGLARTTPIAPVLLAFVELAAAVEVVDGLRLGLVVEPGLGLTSARFLGPAPSNVIEGANLQGERRAQVDLLGPGIYGGLTMGYRF